MKINKLSGPESISTQMSIDRVDDENKKQQPAVPAVGYKSKQLRAVLKFRKFAKENEVSEDKEKRRRRSARAGMKDEEKNNSEKVEPSNNIRFSDDIPLDLKARVNELLTALSAGLPDDEAFARIIRLNKNNISEFINILVELKNHSPRPEKSLKDGRYPGSLIDYRA